MLIQGERAGQPRVANGDGIGRVDAGVVLLAWRPESAVDPRSRHKIVDHGLYFGGGVAHVSPYFGGRKSGARISSIVEPFARAAVVNQDGAEGYGMRIVEGDGVGRGAQARGRVD